MNDEFIFAASFLPQRIKNALLNLNPKLINDVSEIRLRVGRPVALTAKCKNIYPEISGYGFIPGCRSIIPTADELEDTLFLLCGKSVYSHETEIANGYISLPGGHRAGVCGTVINRVDGTLFLRNISSINIRIAKPVKNFANKLMNIQNCKGLLICGAPHTGKTTLLRDYIRQCSNIGERISLIDCRGEIAAADGANEGMDVGTNTDVITGGSKKSGIENALRAMAPDMVAFDEIGNVAELNAISDCMNSGVRTVTTIHAANRKELLQRNKYLPVLNTGAFSHIAFTNKNFEYEIIKLGDMYDEARSSVDNSRVVLSLRNKKSNDTFATG